MDNTAAWSGTNKRSQDPFYEYYKDTKGKEKRRKRQPPPGLTPHEEKVWRKIAKHAHRLDRGIRIAGFRFGYTAIIGFIPYAGTAANGVLNWSLVIKPAKEAFEYVRVPCRMRQGTNDYLYSLPSGVVDRMKFNSLVGCAVNLVPLVGDIVLAAWGANARNVHLVERHLAKRAPSGTTVPSAHAHPQV